MRNFALTYPITVYAVDTDYSTGAVTECYFKEPPTNYDAHIIKFNKFIWRSSNGCDVVEFFLKKKDAKKAGLAITRQRIKLLNQQVNELKKVLKETIKL